MSVRLEIVVAACEYGAYEPENVKLVFAFCDFPKIVINPRSDSLIGCGKSCELELKRVAFLSELPIWLSLVVQTDECFQEIASAQFNLFALIDDLSKPRSSVPFRLFKCEHPGNLGFEVQIRLTQHIGESDEVFLATFTDSEENAPPTVPKFIATTPPRLKRSAVKLDTPLPESDTTFRSVTCERKGGVVGGKMRTRGLKINLSKR